MNISDISTTGIITLVILAFAAIAFIKGFIKLLYGLICLAGTLVAGWIGYFYGYPLLLENWPQCPENAQYACAITAALLAFFILKGITRFFLNPLSSSEDAEKKGTSFLGIFTGFVMGFLLCLLGMDRLIDQGSRAELQYWVGHASDAAPKSLPGLSAFKDFCLSTTLGQQWTQLFHTNDLASQNLAKLAIMQVTAPEKLEQLSETPAIATLLENPQIQSFLQQPSIAENLRNGNTDAIVDSPELAALLEDPEMNRAIAQIDIEQALKLR